MKWQTRCSQKAVKATSWEFDSPPRYNIKLFGVRPACRQAGSLSRHKMEIDGSQNNSQSDFNEILKVFVIVLTISLFVGIMLIIFSPETIPWSYHKGEFTNYQSKYSLFKIPLFLLGWAFVGFLLYRTIHLTWKIGITLFPWSKPVGYKNLRFLFGIEINDTNVTYYLQKNLKNTIIIGLILAPTIYIPLIGMILRVDNINSLFSLYVVFFVISAVILYISLARKNIK